MSKELKKYKAQIFGESYSIMSDEEDEFVLEVVRRVDGLMKEIATQNKMVIDVKKIAVFAALKATEELLTMEEMVKKEQMKSEKIMTLLDEEEEFSF
ncbi:MAG TPA: cell division protein ZapA [Candidatus Saccharimonadales bacterium]|nr:cell division protein ZapA [Candidatus Saccharimonadales bacterium]